jgi:SAM-dependent MidA family methyltransferase
MKTLFKIIKKETNGGIVPFARFMELALYCPDFGYYELQKRLGRHGDFFTSVSTGELFGQLLAFQFAEWLEEIKSSLTTHRSPIFIVEAGAHDGQLASDILNWLQTNRPKLFDQIEYVIIEPSRRRQEWQRETLKNFAERIRWFADFKNLESKTKKLKLPGIVFSNELLDAFPICRFGWDAKKRNWFEWGVTVDGEKFIWARMPKPVHDLRFTICVPKELLDVLPDGFTTEICPAAENWWREAAGVLQRGKLLAIDYGFNSDEMFSPERARGTLRAYFRQHVTDDILANPGEQDLTAHVNFSAIQNVGEEAGLKTEMFSRQATFLTQILKKTLKEKSFEWSTNRTRQFQTLTHPEHLGRAFRVLVQSRCNS